jgi:hypothetical protein
MTSVETLRKILELPQTTLGARHNIKSYRQGSLDARKSVASIGHLRESSQLSSRNASLKINPINCQQQGLLHGDKINLCSTSSSFHEADQSYDHNMKRVAEFVEFQSKNAPKFISNFKLVSSLVPGLGPQKGNYGSQIVSSGSRIIDTMKGTHLKQPETIGRLPASTKKFFIQLQKPCQSSGFSLVEPPTPDLPKQRFKPQASPLPVVENIGIVINKYDHYDDPVETFSLDAHSKMSHLRIKNMNKSPVIKMEGEADEPASYEKSQQFDSVDDNVNNQRIVIVKDIQDAILRSREIKSAQTDKPFEFSSKPLWNTVSCAMDMVAPSSTKSILLVKTRFHPQSSKFILGTRLVKKGSQDHSKPTKKKVVFAKNKMVLLFEKDK